MGGFFAACVSGNGSATGAELGDAAHGRSARVVIVGLASFVLLFTRCTLFYFILLNLARGILS